MFLNKYFEKFSKMDSEEAIFRSAPMTLVQFYVTIEIARDVVYNLGTIGKVHFRDLNSRLTPFQRTFVDELRKIDSIDTQLKFLKDVMLKYDCTPNDETQSTKDSRLPSSSEMDDLVSRIASVYDRIKYLDDSYDQLNSERYKYLENRYVLNEVDNFHSLSSGRGGNQDEGNFVIQGDSDTEDDVALLNQRNHSLEEAQEVSLEDAAGYNSICGTIESEKVGLLRNILWRASRGNLFFHSADITQEKLPDFSTNKMSLINKSVFIIFTHGDFLKSRIKKILQSLDGVLYENTEGGATSRNETLNYLNSRIEDITNVVLNTKNHLISELVIFQDSYASWLYTIERERMIYEVLNKFDFDSTRRCLVAEGWIPTETFGSIKSMLRKVIRSKSYHGSYHARVSEESIEIADQSNASIGDENYSLLTTEGGHGDDTVDNSDEEYDSLVAVVNELMTNRTPPTYHKTNKFTAAFQSIIDAYGIATYQEVNPGLPTVVTFPFMFAIMFGDLGHGFIVMLVALYLILNEVRFQAKKNKDEIFEMAFNGRYIILLMGIFSIYTGLLYNDIFSKSMTLFKSGWVWDFPKDYDPGSKGRMSISAKKVSGHTYPFGLDWAWHGAENNLLFTNSYKMKLSVLMGYIHMNYSLMFSLVNYRFFRSKVDIIGNFIPGFLFMQSIFGYLCITIIYKWSVDWVGTHKQPPGLLNMLINMFLAPGKVDEQLYPGQSFVQVVLVLIAVVCVPWLLLYKPMVLRRKNNTAVEQGYSNIHSQRNHSIQLHEEEEAIILENELRDDNNDDDAEHFKFPNDIEPMFHNSASHDDDDNFNFGDIVIHQVIHTIEFCLNCVSHTASYLRLWALSLAHSQLSTVLWEMTIKNAFGMQGTKGIIMTVVLFGMWFILTVCILVMMEGTSAMLHSLRLHWVEAMSKFFEGEGYAFTPFNFDSISL
ncbi:Piso0_000961 [Millerozyma farinosa CBS 7064]|uniref:V-type proton ATPase subunit a n=1 Tax=Pichia sorbitophila (strain ATCC MYA-4447 / BCRC 22081 / CBS 7064 / NBRC 10061 / NRRL Y-12695) TaxID=559304 RepID=G8YS03_PICSO|nr:Piso0_000961 [Millerozyma farinosa CBS 7064]CCE78926.1 Piso0_000961 [Millerozyma farinosa CBS 7064]